MLPIPFQRLAQYVYSERILAARTPPSDWSQRLCPGAAHATSPEDLLMLNPLIHYEVELANQYQERRRRDAALIRLAAHEVSSAHRGGPAHLGWRHLTVAMLAILLRWSVR